MSASKHVTIWCDEEGCYRFIEVGEQSAFGPARAQAREEGWRTGKQSHHRGGGKDFCPDHAGELE